MITTKCTEALKSYVVNRAKYGICGAKMTIPHLRMLEKAGLIVRGPCASIEDFTADGEKLVATLFA